MAQDVLKKLVQNEPKTTLELSEETGLSVFTVSRQMNAMARYGEIGRKPIGMQTVWWIKDEAERSDRTG